LRPYSVPDALGRLDLRTRQAKVAREVRDELTAHVGGSPTVTQKLMIEQLVQLRLRLAAMDTKFADVGMTDLDGRTYLAWANSFARMLRMLGLNGTKQRSGPTLAEILADER
jgi:hypothetical protein